MFPSVIVYFMVTHPMIIIYLVPENKGEIFFNFFGFYVPNYFSEVNYLNCIECGE